MTVKSPRIRSALVLIAALTLQGTAHADDPPQVSNVLKKMLATLPLKQDRAKLDALVGSLKKTGCGGGLTGCYMTQSGPVHLYFFTSGTAQQTFLVVDDEQIDMPKILGSKVQGAMGKSKLGTPIFSISTTDYTLRLSAMPPWLQQIVHDHYFNVSDLSFSSGVQLAASVQLDGGIQHAMKTFGADLPGIVMRAAAVLPIPTDLTSGAGTGAGLAEDITHGATMSSAAGKALLPEAFVEFQFAPGTKLPIPEPAINLSDPTFFLNNDLVFGYKGNAKFAGDDKNLLVQFQTPLTPEGAISFADFSFRMATPSAFTMTDEVVVMFDMAVPDARLIQYGGGFIRGISGNKQSLVSAMNSVAVFTLANPVPPPTYRYGDPDHPWPNDPKYFNVALISPLADGGPLMTLSGDLKLLGQEMGSFYGSIGGDGLYANATSDINLRLGPLGHVKVPKMVATANINARRQDISLKGKFGDQPIDIEMSGNTLTADVPATCSNPFKIHFSASLDPGLDIASQFETQGGVTVDPSTITGCVGDALTQAYGTIANQYQNTAGYTVDEARAQYDHLANAGNAAYQATKNNLRVAAGNFNSAATKAFNAIGNAFKHPGKKKHSSGPDPRMAAEVFDWDYYYDAYPDLQANAANGLDLGQHWMDHGINEGRQASRVFSIGYYYARYLDVQQQCPGFDRLCTVNHWLNYGIAQGRQASSGFSVASYLARYPDLISAYGATDYPDALAHWMTTGEDQGRSGSPDPGAAAGPVMGPVDAGGSGGSPWDDGPACQNQPITGWNIWFGSQVDGVQFGYGNNGYSGVFVAAHGHSAGPPKASLALSPGEWVTRVDYRSGSMMDQIAFITNLGRTFGPYGGNGGTAASYSPTPGEKVGCMSGRSGSSMDHLTFSSTNWR